jgi:hypothetical protein
MQYVRAIAQYYLIWLNLKIDGVIAIKSFVHRPVKLLYHREHKVVLEWITINPC